MLSLSDRMLPGTGVEQLPFESMFSLGGIAVVSAAAAFHHTAVRPQPHSFAASAGEHLLL